MSACVNDTNGDGDCAACARNPEAPCRVSARDHIHERIHGPGYCDPPCGLCQEVEDLLDAYAHQLAEKQRHHFGIGNVPVRAHCDPDCDYCRGVTDAADLIDPEITS